MSSLRGGVAWLRRGLGARWAPQPHPDLVRLTAEDRRYLTSFHDDSVPLPASAAAELTEDNPRLQELRSAYAAYAGPARAQSRWNREAVEGFLDLRHFRGETLITWHRRELPRISALKYFVFLRYLQARDSLGLLERLGEDGAFGCWTFAYPGQPRVSRDLLDSVAEILFLERQLSLSSRPRFSVLDIGAGYGRLAHRMSAAFSQLEDVCCVDAIPECTFLSEYYLRFRGCRPPARVLALPQVEGELEAGHFDLAVNIHSFSECPEAAVAWWVGQVARLRIPWLLVVPNEPRQLLTLEADGSRRDFAPILERAGYRLACREPVIDAPAERELLRLEDHFHLYARRPDA